MLRKTSYATPLPSSIGMEWREPAIDNTSCILSSSPDSVPDTCHELDPDDTARDEDRPFAFARERMHEPSILDGVQQQDNYRGTVVNREEVVDHSPPHVLGADMLEQQRSRPSRAEINSRRSDVCTTWLFATGTADVEGMFDDSGFTAQGLWSTSSGLPSSSRTRFVGTDIVDAVAERWAALGHIELDGVIHLEFGEPQELNGLCQYSSGEYIPPMIPYPVRQDTSHHGEDDCILYGDDPPQGHGADYGPGLS